MHDLGLLRANTKKMDVIKNKIGELDQQFDLGIGLKFCLMYFDFLFLKMTYFAHFYFNISTLISVMIAEEMDKSLLLLQKLTCWPLRSFTYLSLNQRKESFKNTITAESREILRKWLFPDYMLYDYFKEKFNERLKSEASFIASNIEKLEEENKKVYSDCVISKTDNKNGLKGDFRMWSHNSLGYKINEDNFWCRFYAISEMAYTKVIRKLQKDRKQ